MAVRFIPGELVVTIHNDLMKRYGGKQGIRDENLLSSALAQPQMTAFGKDIHKSLVEKASAYGFHVCKNHPFNDGNKRIAIVLMDMFLQINGWEIIATEEDAYSIMMNLASGNCTKQQLAEWLKNQTAKLSK